MSNTGEKETKMYIYAEDVVFVVWNPDRGKILKDLRGKKSRQKLVDEIAAKGGECSHQNLKKLEYGESESVSIKVLEAICTALTQREKYLIHLYCNCKFEMTPQEFYRKWEVNQAPVRYLQSDIGLPSCRFYRRPLAQDLRHLALMDFLLESFEEIPSKILDRLCLSKNQKFDTGTRMNY